MREVSQSYWEVAENVLQVLLTTSRQPGVWLGSVVSRRQLPTPVYV